MAFRAEMRRAVWIRIGGREGVRHELVDPANHQEVHKPFHEWRPFRPSERAEDFAHRAPFEGGIQMRRRGTQFRQHVMEKFRIHITS